MTRPHEKIGNEALEAFWAVVVKHFPQAMTGDLSPWVVMKLHLLAEEAIGQWILCNVPVPIGYRFTLAHDVDRFPAFIAKAGNIGTVTVADGTGIWARMDLPIDGCEQWDNVLHWEFRAEFLGATEPLGCYSPSSSGVMSTGSIDST